jgi:ribonuclease HI
LTKSLYLGDNFTNNVAEYFSLLLGLEEATKRHILHLEVQGDSLLVINQVTGKWKVKNDNLKKLCNKAKYFKNKFNFITFSHIYREGNKRADELANQALDNL